jgi:hypothetical protein
MRTRAVPTALTLWAPIRETPWPEAQPDPCCTPAGHPGWLQEHASMEHVPLSLPGVQPVY